MPAAHATPMPRRTCRKQRHLQAVWRGDQTRAEVHTTGGAGGGLSLACPVHRHHSLHCNRWLRLDETRALAASTSQTPPWPLHLRTRPILEALQVAPFWPRSAVHVCSFDVTAPR